MPDTPLFTLSREDIYDYRRCPKIVSIKAFRALHRPQVEKQVEKVEETGGASKTGIIGAIGEAATKVILSPPAAILSLITSPFQLAQRILSQMGIQLDEAMRKLLEETLEGLKDIRGHLTEEYGEVQVIGRGQSRNGPMPGQAVPDFVAISPKDNRPILVEVKNTARSSPRLDRFQAAYYNTLAKEVGVVVLEERIESGRRTLTPKSFHDAITETIVVYPRLKRYERVADTLDLEEELIEEVWRAKQLGYMGRAPYVDCGNTCPHRKLGQRLGIELPEGNMETAPPLPLIYAEGLVERGADLDAIYLRHFLWRIGIGSAIYAAHPDLMIAPERTREEVKGKLVKLIIERTGLPAEIAGTLFVERQSLPKAGEIIRVMAGEIEPWQTILGRERVERSVNIIQGLASKLFTLPKGSEYFVKRSWKKWEAG